MRFKTVRQAEHFQSMELKKQIWIIFGSAVCALREHPHWKFGNERCHKFLDEANRLMMEQEYSGFSMPEICEKETKMIMMKGNKSYKSIYLLNSDEWYKSSIQHDGYIGLTETQKIAHIEDVIGWIPQILEAAALTAMHRVFGWGNRTRLPELLECIDGIRAECRNADYYMDLLKYNYGTVFDLKN